MASEQKTSTTIISTQNNHSSHTDSHQIQPNEQRTNSKSEMTITNDDQTLENNLKQHQDANAQLIERNVKQIHIREESTIKKVVKTREVKHFNASGELITSQVADDQSPLPNQDVDFDINPNQPDNLDGHVQDNDINIHQNLHNNEPNEQEVVMDNRRVEPSDPALHDKNSSSNYQNLFTNNQPNFSKPISGQIGTSQPSMQSIQRINPRNTNNLPTSGYEELDSTFVYPNNNQQQQMSTLIYDPNTNIYGTKNSLLVQPLPSNSTVMVQQQDNTTQPNGASYINQKSNYDIAYGTTIPVAQVPFTNNSKIYGTRVGQQEPVYAINRNGTLTHITQNSTDESSATDVRWRDPELEEVIEFLSNPDPMIRANSVAYLQHLSYADDVVKQKTRTLGGINLLIDLLNRDILEVQRNVCGALRNLSYGRRNDDNKRAIRDAQGIQALVRCLINNPDNEIREVATSVLWNLSSCEDIKWSIVDIALNPLVSVILVPYTAWFKANLNNSQQFLPTASETHWSTVFRNATGVLRNISSAGAHARKQLRDCDDLVESLFFIINTSINSNDVENKLVENCVCILRNLSYRCQETQDPDYDKHYYSQNSSQTDSLTNNSPSSPSSSGNLTTSLVDQVTSKVGDNIGCFSFAKRSKSKTKSRFLSIRNNNNLSNNSNDNSASTMSENRSTLLPPHHPSHSIAASSSSTMVRTSTQLDGFNSTTLPQSGLSEIQAGSNNPNQIQGKELLWQPEVVKPYLSLLSGCSNSETLEAAAGAIQNLAACYWQPSIEIRAAVRKERGLPVLVELLRMDRDGVVCVVATALRNLAIDQKNKELIGKYAMLDLVNKLMSESDQESPPSDDTIAAVLATLHEVISNNVDFVRSFYEAGGMNKLTYIIRNKSKFSLRVQRFTAQVSFSDIIRHLISLSVILHFVVKLTRLILHSYEF